MDYRTTPAGIFNEFEHPHWDRDDTENYPGRTNEKNELRTFSRFEVHDPEQDAFGDWAGITVGEQVYLWGDFHPAGSTAQSEMKIAWFTSKALGQPFKLCDSIGSVHPDLFDTSNLLEGFGVCFKNQRVLAQITPLALF